MNNKRVGGGGGGDTESLLLNENGDMDLIDYAENTVKKVGRSFKRGMEKNRRMSSWALLLREFIGKLLITMVISTTVCLFPLKADLLLVAIVSGTITMAVHWFFTRTSPNDFNFGITMARVITGKVSIWDALVLLLGNACGTVAGIALTLGFVGSTTFDANVPSIYNPYTTLGITPSHQYQAMGALACAQFCLYFFGSSYEFVFTKAKKFGKSALIGGLVLALTITTYTFASGGLDMFYALFTSAMTSQLDITWVRTFLYSNLISIGGLGVVYWAMTFLDIRVLESSSASSTSSTKVNKL